MLKRFLIKNWLVIVLAVVPPAVLWYVFQRGRSDLRITIDADVPVVSLEQQFADSVRIFFGNEQVSSLSVIELSIENTGNRPVERSAFDSPLVFVFPGRVTAKPAVLDRRPDALAPDLRLIPPDTVTVAPLLLNGGDRFRIRAYVADRVPDAAPVRVWGRVSGISEISIQSRAEDVITVFYWIGVLASIAVGVLSFFAFYTLFGRLRVMRVSVSEMTLEFAKRLEAQEGVREQARELAQELGIARHDLKTNLLLLRLRVEALLREIASAYGLKIHGSINGMGRVLGKKGHITHAVAAAIRNFAPNVNRELHEVESVLSDEQHESLLRLGLNLVAMLESIRDGVAPPEPSAGRRQ